ncbi:hypothetical protein [Neorhodopirellula pilleata]|uniref:hypothetical protein n=1 Tax=Neorhodopirellula pilleata TaxID=2714738 RepID=UPI0011B50138|nr:hypothetical protein [Neorhodopirellula pilleata]
MSVVLALVLRRKALKTFFVATTIAALAFIPLCAGVGSIVDSQRFGVFKYETYADVRDFRIERYLPPHARNITLDKYAMGHRAMYTITLEDLTEYLDQLWADADGQSFVSREDLGHGESIVGEQFDHSFDGLDWPIPESAIHFHSPVQSDGGGADYYFDTRTSTVLQHAGYW